MTFFYIDLMNGKGVPPLIAAGSACNPEHVVRAFTDAVWAASLFHNDKRGMPVRVAA
jgi:imidazole glycerol phosphate synthase subunit HisF